MKVCFIHGANASHTTFAYIESKIKIPRQDIIAIEYNSREGFYNNLHEMISILRRYKGENIFFIAHSLGGIYAIHLAEAFRTQVVGAVTISTPYGGAETGDWLKWIFPSHQLFKDIGRYSPPIDNSLNIDVGVMAWTQIISNKGFAPHIPFNNDGVVTIRSMSFRNDMEKIEVPANHYEIVLSDTVVDIIKEKLNEVYRSS